VIRFRSVDLPAPFGPTSPVTVPVGTVSVHSVRACLPRYCLPRPCVSMTASMPATITAGAPPPRRPTVQACPSYPGRMRLPERRGYGRTVKITPVRLDCAAALALAAAAIVGFHELARTTAVPRALILIVVLMAVLPAA